jgi:hypothetical protein
MQAQCLGMMTFSELPPVPSDHLVPFTDQLRLAVAAYLARFKGSSRYHTESDLRCYLAWCTERGLDPLAARRPHLELYVRSMQEVRRFKLSTVSRRLSVAAGFYRTCVIDGLLEHSPAEHVRRLTSSGRRRGQVVRRKWPWRCWVGCKEVAGWATVARGVVCHDRDDHRQCGHQQLPDAGHVGGPDVL